MAARNNLPELRPERARQLLSEWFATRHTTSVAFREETNPKNDPQDDYLIAYEAVFEPDSLDQAYVDIGVTPDGCVAIGFETRERIAARLGVKNRRSGFASGHEPYPLSEQGLLAILDVIANGQIAIPTKVLPWIGLGPFGVGLFKALVLPESLETLVANGYGPVTWLQAAKQSEFSVGDHFLHFRPW